MPEPSLPKWTICDVSRFPYVYVHVECVTLHRWSAKSFIAESTYNGCQREAESIGGKTAVLSRNNFFSSGSVSSFSFSDCKDILSRMWKWISLGNISKAQTSLSCHTWIKSIRPFALCNNVLFIWIHAIVFIWIHAIVFIRIHAIMFIRE